MNEHCKRFAAGILTLLLLVSMAACTLSSEQSPSEEQTPPVQTSGTTQEQENSEPNNTLRNFAVADATGSTIMLNSMTGKPVVLNLWASWCPPCRAEMPHFEKAYQDNPDIEFMMINLSTGDTLEDAAAFLAEGGYTFPVYYDVLSQAAIACDASAIPVTIFLNSKGEVVYRKVGGMTGEELEQRLDQIRGQ